MISSILTPSTNEREEEPADLKAPPNDDERPKPLRGLVGVDGVEAEEDTSPRVSNILTMSPNSLRDTGEKTSLPLTSRLV